jgi:hypothetical protein
LARLPCTWAPRTTRTRKLISGFPANSNSPGRSQHGNRQDRPFGELIGDFERNAADIQHRAILCHAAARLKPDPSTARFT